MDPKKMKVLHWPRLDTVLVVENIIRKLGIFSSKKRLNDSLPKKIMPQTLNIILRYLEESGKIKIQKRRIMWMEKTQAEIEYQVLRNRLETDY